MARFPQSKISPSWLAWMIPALSLNVVGAPPTEHDIKAAYVLSILKFVHRKEAPANRERLAMCLVASGLVEQPLRALENSVVGGRKLGIRTIQKNDDLRSCEAVFIGRSVGYQGVVDRARSLGLLTVGNDSDFIPMSGMVALLVEGRRIVVEVNGEAVKSVDWVFSSHLLEIARVTPQSGIR